MTRIGKFFENSIVRSVIIGVLVVSSIFGVRNVIAQNNTISYYACVNNSSGTIKMINVDKDCSKNETKISWNQVGPKGDKGDQGPVGDVGATGPQGAKGDKGDKGDQGPAGVAGATGPQGAQGDKGDKGDQGPAGDVGATGPQGSKGDKGDKGDQGPAGDVGATGPQGPPGPAGQGGSGLKSIAGHVNLIVQNGYVPTIVSGSGFTVNVSGGGGGVPNLVLTFPPGTFNSIAIPILQPIGSYAQLINGRDIIISRYSVGSDGSMWLLINLPYNDPPWDQGSAITGFTFVVTETGTPLPSSSITHTISD